MIIPSASDTVLQRILPALSLFGNCDLDVSGRERVTRSDVRLPIRITPSFFRKFECPAACSSICCRVFDCSLDFFDTEPAWLELPEEIRSTAISRSIDVNGTSLLVYSWWKPREYVTNRNDFRNVKCQFLQPIRDGHLGCSIWQTGNPLECGSAYNMRVTELADRIAITKQGLGRAWAYKESPLCEFNEVVIDKADIESNIAIFNRYRQWADRIGYQPAVERLSLIIRSLDQCIQRNTSKICLETLIFP
jgi:hypothetical protein